MAARGGPRPNSGRPKGSLNKATIERLEQAATQVTKARAAGKKLGKDILDDFAQLFAGMAAAYQPMPPGVAIPPGRQPDETKFKEYAELAVYTAYKLAEFQSPKFKAIAVVMSGSDQQQDRGPLPPNVIAIDDPDALTRVYRRRISGAA